MITFSRNEGHISIRMHEAYLYDLRSEGNQRKHRRLKQFVYVQFPQAT